MNAFLTEAAKIARSQPAATIITAALVAIVTVTAVLTTGRTFRAEQTVLDRFEQAGSRIVVITDTRGTAGLTGGAVARIAALTDIEWVIGLGPAQDGRNAAPPTVSRPAATRAIHGNLHSVVTVEGSSPTSNAAVGGSGALDIVGLKQPAGCLILDNGNTLAVVGTITAVAPLEFLADTFVHTPNSTTDEVRVIYATVANPTTIGRATSSAIALLEPADPSSISIETSEDIAALRSVVAGDLGRLSRQLLMVVLATGLLLVAAVMYAATVLRQKDFGRRRALGATRSTIVGLIAISTAIASIAGAGVGVVVAVTLEYLTTNQLPAPAFTLAAAVLAILTSTLATIPPALRAAHRDPVRALRIP